MKLVCCAAHDAFSGVSFPYLEFYGSWDESSPGGIQFRGDGQVFFAFHGFEFELEHDSVLVLLLPRIHEMEDAVIRPDSRADFLVHPDLLRRPGGGLRLLRSSMETAVLRRTYRRVKFWLVDQFRIRRPRPFRLIVALVNQRCTAILNEAFGRTDMRITE